MFPPCEIHFSAQYACAQRKRKLDQILRTVEKEGDSQAVRGRVLTREESNGLPGSENSCGREIDELQLRYETRRFRHCNLI